MLPLGRLLLGTKDAAHDGGCCPVSFFDEVAVHPKGEGRVRVAEPVGHSSDVHASSNELGGSEVPKIMEPDVWSTDLVSDSDEERRHVVGTEGRLGFDEGGEDERIRTEGRSCGGDPLVNSCPMFGEQRNSERVESNLSGAPRLRGFLGEPTRHDNQRTGDAHDPELKVYVGPAKGAEFPSAHTRESSEHEEWSKPWVPLLCCIDDLVDDIDGGSLHLVMFQTGRLRPFSDVVPDPPPPDSLVEGGGDDGVVVPDGLRRGSGVLHGAVQLVEIPGRETAQEDLAKPWPDGRLDLCSVGPEGGWGEVEPFALFEPLVEELTEGRSDSIWAGRSLLVDEVPEGFVCGPGGPVEGLLERTLYLSVTGSFPRETRSSHTPRLISRFDPRTKASVARFWDSLWDS